MVLLWGPGDGLAQDLSLRNMVEGSRVVRMGMIKGEGNWHHSMNKKQQ